MLWPSRNPCNRLVAQRECLEGPVESLAQPEACNNFWKFGSRNLRKISYQPLFVLDPYSHHALCLAHPALLTASGLAMSWLLPQGILFISEWCRPEVCHIIPPFHICRVVTFFAPHHTASEDLLCDSGMLLQQALFEPQFPETAATGTSLADRC